MEKQKSNIKRLLDFAGEKKILIYFACGLSAVSSVLMLMPFICMWKASSIVLKNLDNIGNMDMEGLKFYGLLAFLLAVIGMIVYFIALMCSHIAAFHTAKNMKSTVLRHLIGMPLGYFSEKTTGRLRKIIEENSSQTETFLAHQMPDMAASYITPVVILVLLFIFDWRLGLLSVIPFIAAFILQNKMMSGASLEFMKKYQDSLEEMNKEAVEYVRGIPVVKVFQQTVYSFKSFYNSIMQYKKFVIAYTLTWEKPMTIFTTLLNATFILLIPGGIIFSYSAGDYAKFCQDYIFYLLFAPACGFMINKIMYATSYKMIAEESLRRIEAILAEKPMEEPKNPEFPKGNDIKFSNVTFSYGSGLEPALKNVSFLAEKGTKTALVGPSGGGKTTAASLIPRFFDVNEGSIKIGGADVKNIPEKVLMEQTAFVFQDTHLFKDSILNNVRAGKKNAKREEVEVALNLAQCDDILKKLPNGIDTVIGREGIYLSGGEQQRIAIARAILKNAPIVILDEATAFADPENEHKIQAAFEKLIEGKTVIMIAHRLSTVKNADQIIVLDNGEIAETGKHEELVQKGGIYAKLWKDYQTSISWTVGKGANYVS